MINTIILGHVLNILPQLPAGSVNCVVTSPPYWNLRDYGIEPVIWDEDKNCKHEWGNKTITLKHKSVETNPGKESWFKDRGASDDKGNCFCIKCGAWRGSLGLEPTFDLYIKHLCQIFDEVKRVLRKDGTCFVNIGDSYWGSGQGGADYGGKEIIPSSNFGHIAKGKNYPNKSLCDIPYRFSIEMINRGWIKRNTIIWWKPNCMPSSAPDRFTIDFEYLFSFVKNNKTLFWTNEKTLECVDKRPLGIKGIEGKDWEWRPCPRCQGTGGETKINKENAEKMGSPRARYHRITKQEKCKRCKGLGKIKVSFWTGHDYWFEQQFENFSESYLKDNRPMGIIRQRFYPNSKYVKSGMIKLEHKANVRDWQDGINKRGKDAIIKIHPELGRNKRCVWIIPTQPFPEAHFAVYPEGLIEIPIKAGCPTFICKKCGKARVKIFKEATGGTKGHSWHDHSADMEKGNVKKQTGSEYNTYKHGNFIGYSDCGCDAGFESGIVLDPFMGAGTTALVALKQRKRFIGIEIKQEYIDMSYKRIAKVQQRIF